MQAHADLNEQQAATCTIITKQTNTSMQLQTAGHSRGEVALYSTAKADHAEEQSLQTSSAVPNGLLFESFDE